VQRLVHALVCNMEVTVGLFDDAVPGGAIAKPLMIALGALLVGKMMTGGGQQTAPAAGAGDQPQTGGLGGGLTGGLAGGLAGGLGGLLDRLTQAGHSDAANSWVGTGPNVPIQPGQLGSALGQTTITDLAQHSGMSEQELLAQLAKVLPGVVDKLTPGGNLPSHAQVRDAIGPSMT
jgi:uncharacterized protein YidB (DUF937 family)